MIRRIRDYDIASKAAMLSVASNAALMVVKVLAALAFGSVALLGDGIDSAEDLVASALVFFSVRLAMQPADETHPYGHGKAESLAALSQAALIAGGAIFIAVAAINRLFADDPEIAVGPSLAAVAVTALVNLLVAGYAFRAARISGSVAVASDARHLLTNVAQAGAIGLALVLVAITGNQVFDPIFAILLAAFLLWVALGIFRGAVHELVDSALPPSILAAVVACIEQPRPGIRGHHGLRTRKSGRETYIDVHLLVDPSMSVSDAHDVADQLERDLMALVPGASINTHTDPDHPHMHDSHAAAT